jgi:hypothetical protein
VSTNRPGARRRLLPPGRTLFTEDASPGRQSIERRSAAPLLFLRQLPPWLLPVGFAVLVFGGLTVRGALGAVLLVVAAAFLAWLGLVSWPRLSPVGRLGRAAVVVLILVAAGIMAVR